MYYQMLCGAIGDSILGKWLAALDYGAEGTNVVGLIPELIPELKNSLPIQQ